MSATFQFNNLIISRLSAYARGDLPRAPRGVSGVGAHLCSAQAALPCLLSPWMSPGMQSVALGLTMGGCAFKGYWDYQEGKEEYHRAVRLQDRVAVKKGWFECAQGTMQGVAGGVAVAYHGVRGVARSSATQGVMRCVAGLGALEGSLWGLGFVAFASKSYCAHQEIARLNQEFKSERGGIEAFVSRKLRAHVSLLDPGIFRQKAEKALNDFGLTESALESISIEIRSRLPGTEGFSPLELVGLFLETCREEARNITSLGRLTNPAALKTMQKMEALSFLRDVPQPLLQSLKDKVSVQLDAAVGSGLFWSRVRLGLSTLGVGLLLVGLCGVQLPVSVTLALSVVLSGAWLYSDVRGLQQSLCSSEQVAPYDKRLALLTGAVALLSFFVSAALTGPQLTLLVPALNALGGVILSLYTYYKLVEKQAGPVSLPPSSGVWKSLEGTRLKTLEERNSQITLDLPRMNITVFKKRCTTLEELDIALGQNGVVGERAARVKLALQQGAAAFGREALQNQLDQKIPDTYQTLGDLAQPPRASAIDLSVCDEVVTLHVTSYHGIYKKGDIPSPICGIALQSIITDTQDGEVTPAVEFLSDLDRPEAQKIRRSLREMNSHP